MKRVLLDENLPKDLRKSFSSAFEVTTVPGHGWQSKSNGELLSAMQSEGIEVLLTADRNLRFQQNLGRYGITVAILITYDTRIDALLAHISRIETVLLSVSTGQEYVEVDLR